MGALSVYSRTCRRGGGLNNPPPAAGTHEQRLEKSCILQPSLSCSDDTPQRARIFTCFQSGACSVSRERVGSTSVRLPRQRGTPGRRYNGPRPADGTVTGTGEDFRGGRGPPLFFRFRFVAFSSAAPVSQNKPQSAQMSLNDGEDGRTGFIQS